MRTGVKLETKNTTKLNKEKEKKKSSVFSFIVLVIAILIFIVSSVIIIKWLYETNKSKEVISKVISDVIPNNNNENPNSSELTVDFDKLLAINSQVVGWIKIDGTSINFPIVKGNDNSHYLYYDIYNDRSQNGWIFMDYRNNENFEDYNTVIFGHNIKSGIMFSDLKKIYNQSVKSDIYIYTKDGGVNIYKIYSCYLREPDSNAINVQINKEKYEAFVNEMKSRSIYNYNVDYNLDSKTLTLSTCDSSGENRIIVHAMKI